MDNLKSIKVTVNVDGEKTFFEFEGVKEYAINESVLLKNIFSFSNSNKIEIIIPEDLSKDFSERIMNNLLMIDLSEASDEVFEKDKCKYLSMINYLGFVNYEKIFMKLFEEKLLELPMSMGNLKTLLFLCENNKMCPSETGKVKENYIVRDTMTYFNRGGCYYINIEDDNDILDLIVKYNHYILNLDISRSLLFNLKDVLKILKEPISGKMNEFNLVEIVNKIKVFSARNSFEYYDYDEVMDNFHSLTNGIFKDDCWEWDKMMIAGGVFINIMDKYIHSEKERFKFSDVDIFYIGDDFNCVKILNKLKKKLGGTMYYGINNGNNRNSEREIYDIYSTNLKIKIQIIHYKKNAKLENIMMDDFDNSLSRFMYSNGNIYCAYDSIIGLMNQTNIFNFNNKISQSRVAKSLIKGYTVSTILLNLVNLNEMDKEKLYLHKLYLKKCKKELKLRYIFNYREKFCIDSEYLSELKLKSIKIQDESLIIIKNTHKGHKMTFSIYGDDAKLGHNRINIPNSPSDQFLVKLTIIKDICSNCLFSYFNYNDDILMFKLVKIGEEYKLLIDCELNNKHIEYIKYYDGSIIDNISSDVVKTVYYLNNVFNVNNKKHNAHTANYGIISPFDIDFAHYR